MIGKKAIIPIVNRPIPILADETVDTSKNNGIKRVCPCADKESIALAEKHQLPLDHYVFDREGRYTQYAGEYAGKLRRDFSMNILKYLEDISNLGEVSEEPTTTPYHIHSQEELYPFLMDEIVVDMETEKAILEQDVQTDPLWEPMKTKLLEALPNFSCVLNRQMPR
jgi:valyl-tRNA synthetase